MSEAFRSWPDAGWKPHSRRLPRDSWGVSVRCREGAGPRRRVVRASLFRQTPAKALQRRLAKPRSPSQDSRVRHSLPPWGALLLASLAALRAEVEPAPAEAAPRKGGAPAVLLKLFPDADTDRDGKLSMQEAVAYANAHPELKNLIDLRKGGKATGPRITQPGERSTPDVAGLPAGPRVFVCAHSFMIFTGQQLPPMAESAGVAYRDAGTQMIGGSRALQHWNVPEEQNLAKKALREGTVDVLLLSPHLLLPDEGIDLFTRLGLEKNPNLRVLVQASWPSRDGSLGPFKNEMRDAATVADLKDMSDGYETSWLKPLEAQVNALNATVGRAAARIVPVSRAVLALRQRVAQGTAPGIAKQSDLFRDDLGHPRPPLAALVTYCHFATIYGRSPVGLPVPAMLKDLPDGGAMNTLLQQLAWQAVASYPLSGVRADPHAATGEAAEGVTIASDFPGGNIVLEKIEGHDVYVHPDLRDTKGDWFYWYFAVRGAAGRELTFHFTRGKAIGLSGPGVSRDRGATWNWLGRGESNTSFRYRFAADENEVRFSFGMPYQHADLLRFMERHKGSAHLKVEVLGHTKKGTPVELLRLGKLDAAPDFKVLVTARHHACEMMASHVAEGFMAAFLGDAATARWLREHVECAVVPMVDKDGVEAGDQGKNRQPHDHKADYRGESIYPEVAALREFIAKWSGGRPDVTIDLHNPAPGSHVIYTHALRGTGGRTAEEIANIFAGSNAMRFLQAVESEQTGPLKFCVRDSLEFAARIAGEKPGKRADGRGRGAGASAGTVDAAGPVSIGFEIPYARVGEAEVNTASARAFGNDIAKALKAHLATSPALDSSRVMVGEGRRFAVPGNEK